MNYMVAYFLATVATIMVLFWVVLYLKYSKSFDDILVSIDSKQFMLPELFFIGFGVIALFKVNLKTEKGRKKFF